MRATQKDLDGLVNRLNRTTGNPVTPYSLMEGGKQVANIGNYHLDYAYGGVKLVQMVNNGGGIRTITSGYETKGGCYMQIAAYIKGIEDCIAASAEHDAKMKSIVS